MNVALDYRLDYLYPLGVPIRDKIVYSSNLPNDRFFLVADNSLGFHRLKFTEQLIGKN